MFPVLFKKFAPNSNLVLPFMGKGSGAQRDEFLVLLYWSVGRRHLGSLGRIWGVIFNSSRSQSRAILRETRICGTLEEREEDNFVDDEYMGRTVRIHVLFSLLVTILL